MPKIAEKQKIVDEIKEKIDKAVSVVIVNARGLTVEQDTKLRTQLRNAGIDYKVYKNTMMNFAIKDTAFEGLSKFLEGPSTFAFSYDEPTKAASIISKAAKELKVLEFKGGMIEDVVYDEAGMKAVADIPSKEVLISKLLGSFKSPMASFARVINAVAEKDQESA